jgi:hypothetical protein
MKILLAAVLTIFASIASAAERNPDIETTIQSQLDAFQIDDFEKAFTYASPTIRGIFGSHQRFGMMVQNGFPMVHRPSDVQFLELREQGPLLFQKVRIQIGVSFPAPPLHSTALTRTPCR